MKKDLVKDPGLDRSILSNGVSTIVSSLLGSTPNTTYGENIGVLAISRVYSTWVIGGAAVFAILLSFCGKISTLIRIIPDPVMGGISMLLGDLATIAQYKLPVKLIIFNNRSLGMVKLEMEVDGYLDWQTDMHNPDFDKVAELMGMKGIAVHKAKEVKDAIKTAFEHDGPALINVYTNPNSLAMPPHFTLQQMKGFTNFMFKKLKAGKFGDLEDVISSNIKHIKELF